MSWFHGLTRNVADLAPGATDPRLRPIVLARAPGEALALAAEVIAHLPRWRVEAAEPESGTLHATHQTRLWRFVDDVRLRFEPDPSGTRITGQSRSRIGKGDFGQNARNLRELARALGEAGGATGHER